MAGGICRATVAFQRQSRERYDRVHVAWNYFLFILGTDASLNYWETSFLIFFKNYYGLRVWLFGRTFPPDRAVRISSPGRGHFVVFLGKALNSYSTSLTGQSLNAGGNPAMDWHPIQGGVEILLVASCYWNWEEQWSARALSPYAFLTFPLQLIIKNTAVTTETVEFSVKHSELLDRLGGLGERLEVFVYWLSLASPCKSPKVHFYLSVIVKVVPDDYTNICLAMPRKSALTVRETSG